MSLSNTYGVQTLLFIRDAPTHTFFFFLPNKYSTSTHPYRVLHNAIHTQNYFTSFTAVQTLI